MTISIAEPAEPAAGAKVKIGWDLEAGSTKNEMPPLEFELGEKSPSSTCKFTREKLTLACLKPCVLRWSRFSNHVFCNSRVSKIVVTMAFWEADSRHAGELSVVCFAKKPIRHCQLVDKKLKKH